MKKIFAIILLLFIVDKSYAQEELISFKNSSFYSEFAADQSTTISADANGNTLILYKNTPNRVLHIYIKDSTGKEINVPVPNFSTTDNIEGIKVSEQYYQVLYSNLVENHFVLNRILIKKKNFNFLREENIYSTDEKIITTFLDKDYYLLALTSNNKISCYKFNLDEKNEVETKSFLFNKNVSNSFTPKTRKSIYLPSETSYISNFQLSYLNKVYMDRGKIIIISDGLYSTTTSAGNQVDIVTLNLNDETSAYHVYFYGKYEWGTTYNSYFHDNRLYRIGANSKFISYSIIDFESQKELKSYQLKKNDKDPIIEKPAYFSRNSQKNSLKISTDVTMKEIIKLNSSGTPTIFAREIDGMNILSMGRYYVSEKRGTFIAGINPLVAIVAFAITTGIRNSGNGFGISDHFNISLNDQLEIENKAIDLGPRNDAFKFEVELLDHTKIIGQSYFQSDDLFLFGYYDKKERSFKVVKFTDK